MEARLASLRDMVEGDKVDRKGRADGTRWRAASGQKPLTRGYAQQVLDKKGKAPGGGPGSARGAAPKPEQVVDRLEEMGEFVKLPDFVPFTQTGASSASASKVSSNLAQKIAQDQGSAREVAEFLEGLGLSRYCSLFTEHGFDDMESVLEMQDPHMDAMGIAMGHKLKIAKRIRELKPPPTPPQPRSARSSMRRAQFSPSAPTVAEPAPATAGGSLLDGVYDEEAEAAGFAAAVMAWRQGAAAEAAPAEEAGPSGSFWSKLGEDAGWENRDPQMSAGGDSGFWTPAAAQRPVSPTEARSTGTEEVSPTRPKAACYRCFTQYFVGAPGTVEADGKGFATEECARAHMEEKEAKAARLEELSSTQRKLQERIELVDTVQADPAAAEGPAAPPSALSYEPAVPAFDAAEPADDVFAPLPVARELLPP